MYRRDRLRITSALRLLEIQENVTTFCVANRYIALDRDLI